MEAESHFHPCPGCHEAVECQLVIGDSDCGKLRCANCSPIKSEPPFCQAKNPSGLLLCTLKVGHRGEEHIAHGIHDEIVGRWPITTPTEEAEDDAEEEAETCDNCGEDITPDNPAREFDGDDMCKSCYPCCSTCEEELADDNDDWSRCNSCSDYVCKDCRWWCYCCEVYMCKGCANNGDHGISHGY